MSCPFAGIIKATAPVVAPEVKNIVHDFYPRMFEQNPETKAFFNPANQFAEPPVQRMALANAIVAYASNIDELEKLSGPIALISHKHAGLTVLPEHYSIVHKNLMESIAHVLGSDVVTPEIGGAWSEGVLALAKTLWEEEEKLYKMAESRSGGWRGVKDFKVTAVRKVTDDISEFTFTPVDGCGSIDFTPGQFLTVHLRHEGATPRHYTVTNAPGKDHLQCCVKKIPGGMVSNALHGIEEGTVVGMAAPFGTFSMPEGPAVLVSAGIGATPMKSFMASAPGQLKMIVHVDKNEAAHPFKAEMEACGAKTLFHYTATSGRPTSDVLVESMAPHLSDCNFFLCGPPAFLSDMKKSLEVAGAKNVFVDVFGPGLA